jgi:hypothetical protein
MILDALLMFDTNTGVAITTTRDSTNELDMKEQRDMGVGDNVLDVLVTITEAFTAAGAATLVVEIKGAKNNGGVPGTYYTLASSAAIAVAQLTLGRDIFRTPLPYWSIEASADPLNVPRFYKLTYTVATGPMTAGKVAAFLMDHKGRNANRAYPSGIPVQTYA